MRSVFLIGLVMMDRLPKYRVALWCQWCVQVVLVKLQVLSDADVPRNGFSARTFVCLWMLGGYQWNRRSCFSVSHGSMTNAERVSAV